MTDITTFPIPTKKGSELTLDTILTGSENFMVFDGVNPALSTKRMTLSLLAGGVLEYNAGITYETNYIVRKTGTTQIYKSLTDTNIGNDLTDVVNWELLGDLSDLDNAVQATETQQGTAEVATQTEANTATDDTKMITAAKLSNLVQSNSDTDSTANIGRAQLDSRVTDVMYLSHIDRPGLADYAIKQNQGGDTQVNARSSKSLILSIGSGAKVTIPATGTMGLQNNSSFAPLNIVERSTANTTPLTNDIYLDDGSNTASGSPSFKRYDGTNWIEIGRRSSGAMYFNSNTTATTSPTTPTKISGTYSSKNLVDFNETTDGRLTYTGTATKQFKVESSISFRVAAGNDRAVSLTFAKNGTVITSSEKTSGTGVAAEGMNAAVMDTVELTTNDYIEVFVEITDDTDDVLAEHLFCLITEL